MPIVARLAGPDASIASMAGTETSIGGTSSPGLLLPSGDATGLGPWLELGDGVLRWGWTGLVTGRG